MKFTTSDNFEFSYELTPEEWWQNLIGRDEEVERLLLLTKRKTPLISIVGPPGVGKTALARKFATGYPLRVGFHSVWFQASHLSETAIQERLDDLMEDVRFSIFAKWLVVIDGADEIPIEILKSHIGRIRNYERTTTILLTTRTRASDLSGPNATIYLEALTRQDVLNWSLSRKGLVYELVKELPEAEGQIVEVFRPHILLANDRIIEKLQTSPKDVFQIHPRKFEELIAELLADQGCEVELIQQTHDGGVDILAKLDTPLGKVVTLVDVKRYREDRPVGIELVRQLYGTLSDSQASHGMLVTTSRFTQDANQFQDRHKYELSLKDYGDVLTWLFGYTGVVDK